MSPLQFRPHHFMCTLAFQGKGYSIPFVKNYQNIVKTLDADPNTSIEVISKLDAICKACPNQTEKQSCTKQAFIEKLDAAHAKTLDLKENQILTWNEAKEKIKKNMTLERFHVACEGCQWKAYGICEDSLNELQRNC